MNWLKRAWNWLMDDPPFETRGDEMPTFYISGKDARRMHDLDDVKRFMAEREFAKESLMPLHWDDGMMMPVWLASGWATVFLRSIFYKSWNDEMGLRQFLTAVGWVTGGGGMAIAILEGLSAWWLLLWIAPQLSFFSTRLFRSFWRRAERFKRCIASIDSSELTKTALRIARSRIEEMRTIALGEQSKAASIDREIVRRTKEIEQLKVAAQKRQEEGAAFATNLLDDLERAQEALRMHAASHDRMKRALEEVIAKIEARLPKVEIIVSDVDLMYHVAEVKGSVEDIGLQVARLIPDTLASLDAEFGRISRVVDGASVKALSIPTPHWNETDVQHVIADVTAEEAAFVESLHELEFGMETA